MFLSFRSLLSQTGNLSRHLRKSEIKNPLFSDFTLLFSLYLKIPQSTCDTLIRNINFRSNLTGFLVLNFLVWNSWYQNPYCRQNDKKLRKEKMCDDKIWYDSDPVSGTRIFTVGEKQKSYICPNCGSGSGKNASGMTSRDGEYWKCWRWGLSANKVELFRIQNSLNYEEACAGILKFYGIVPTPIGETSKNRRYGSEPGNGVFLLFWPKSVIRKKFGI